MPGLFYASSDVWLIGALHNTILQQAFDLPVAQPSWHTDEQMDRITTDLLQTFTNHGVPAIGFVNEGKLEVDGSVDEHRLEILRRWSISVVASPKAS